MAYFANGTEGDILDMQCADCPLGYGWDSVESQPRPCPVALIQGLYNYEQIGIPKLKEAMTMLIDKKGVCQVRKELVEIRDAGA